VSNSKFNQIQLTHLPDSPRPAITKRALLKHVGNESVFQNHHLKGYSAILRDRKLLKISKLSPRERASLIQGSLGHFNHTLSLTSP
jgi:hypothetical protein